MTIHVGFDRLLTLQQCGFFCQRSSATLRLTDLPSSQTFLLDRNHSRRNSAQHRIAARQAWRLLTLAYDFLTALNHLDASGTAPPSQDPTMLASDFVLNWRSRAVVVKIECTVPGTAPLQYEFHAELALSMAVAARRVGRGHHPARRSEANMAKAADLQILSLVGLDRKPRQ